MLKKYFLRSQFEKGVLCLLKNTAAHFFVRKSIHQNKFDE